MLLWSIHHHGFKYLYQLLSTCEQTPIVKKQHIYGTKTHETTGNQNARLQSLMRSNSFPGSPFFEQNVRLSSLPSSKNFLKTTEHSWTNILSRRGRRKLFNSSLMNKLIRIKWLSDWVSEWVSEWVPFDCPLSSWMLRHPWAITANIFVIVLGPVWVLTFKGSNNA